MFNQTKNNNLNYLIDPTFLKVNRLFVLSFENEDENEDDRTSFAKYYTPNIEIKAFSVLINGKSFFDTSIKNKGKTYERTIEMGRNNDYTTGKLLDYEHFLKHCKLIVIDLSKHIELENYDFKQKNDFIGRPEQNRTTMFFIIEKSEKTTFEFSQNSVTVV